MTTIRYWMPLERAFERMRRMLFEPFDLGLWIVVAFSAWLARLLDGSSGGANYWTGNKDFGDGWHGGSLDGMLEGIVALVLIGLIALAVLTVVVVLLWVSSRAKFIYLDNAVHARAQIVQPWERFRGLGNSLFLWRLGFMFAAFAVFGLIVLVIVLPATQLDFNDAVHALSVMAIAVGVTLVGLVAIGVAYIALFLDSFVVPIMYRYQLNASDAWRAFIPWLKARPGSFIVYGLFVLLLTLAFAIVSLPVCLVTCCGCIPFISTVILLPLLLTYRMFSVEWLAQFHPDFDLFAAAEAEATEASYETRVIEPEAIEPPEAPEPPEDGESTP